ncbi:putrescine aminotransferase [Cohaesibacter sp. ES.047]|uniref:aspartate aminotransferase family protein n=1 Tax=Cohaesibacter sp. ES.047 TaxID=1798205 RepID=UPI000BB97BC3|nr:aspartate aminotransferase family protein [Cohaesibacter sp. ES.047]SNY90184.1 putrescine aminotransferase [Cohaesibacter sp. ES.047]
MTFMANLPPTAELQQKDAAHHLHPFTDTAELNAKGARVITRADGVYLHDSDGKKYLDGMAGLWCVNVGYGRNEIMEAAMRQMQQLPYYNTFFQTTHPPVIALSEKLTSLAPPHINHVFFAGSGSEANDTVFRMVRHYWATLGKPEKQVIIGRKNGYHGSTVAATSLGGMTAMHKQGGLPIPGVTHIDQPYWYGEGGDMDPDEFGLMRARQLEAEIDRIGEDKVAAFIAEPIQGAGGVVIPPESYWPEIQRICDERDILLVADEVICGFGRTGKWFGSDTYGIKPDLMTIAKGLSSGYLPIAGVLVSDRVAEGLAEGGEFYHGYTYSGHPVACAAALTNLEILEGEGIVEGVHDRAAPYLAEKWSQLGDHPLIGEARSKGLVAALELTPDKAARAPFAAAKGTAGLICREHCFNSGLVMRHVGDTMIISPPLVISNSEIDELVTKAEQALDLALAELKARDLLK